MRCPQLPDPPHYIANKIHGVKLLSVSFEVNKDAYIFAKLFTSKM